MHQKQQNDRLRRLASAAMVFAAVAAVPRAYAEQTGDGVTISWSGATFMRSFTTSRGISLLNPGSTIVLNSGPGGSEIMYAAASGNTTAVQLAAQNLGGTITANPGVGDPPVTTANYAAIRFEWHEQGSIEGILEMVNDQIGTVPSVALINRNGSFGNPTWVNSNPFGQNNLNVVPPPPPTGTGEVGVTTVTVNGYSLRTATYDTYNDFDDSNPARPGRNIHGGQNRVQFAVSDVHAKQGFAITGTPSWNRIPGTAGYGKGNPALPLAAAGDLQGVGTAAVRHEFNDGSVINMSTSRIDPATKQPYAQGPWNNAGVENLRNVVVANGGLAYVANPGTGLERINRSDNVWLHTTGRLQNGADFNVVTRDAYSGTINSGTNNLGLDTTWAVGENDDGNTSLSSGPSQTRIGDAIRYSGKTSGGQGVRPTVQNSRMAFGHLSSSDSIPTSRNNSNRPMRTLDYRDDDNDLADGSNNLLAPELRFNRDFPDPITYSDASKDIIEGFTRLSARSLVEGSYASRTNQTYISVRRPDAVQYDQDFLKGDNSGNDVRDFRDNILASVANFPAASIANPADQLLALSYMLPQFVKVTKDVDGLNRDVPNPAYNATLSDIFLNSPQLTAPFSPAAPEAITTGTTSTYGNNNIGNGSATPVGGSIPINDKNWLFGDFDQRVAAEGISGKRVRDYSDLAVAQAAQAALTASALGVDWNVNAGSNATEVTGLPAAMNGSFTKGDLIVVGDFNSDGVFDGRDLYRMARGTALADNTASAILTGRFADAVRNGVLRKNAALDWLQANATNAQKTEASLDGGLAFVKEDVNRDGKTDLADALTVDKFFGQDYRNLEHQLAATVTVNGTVRPISLVNVELNDTGDITQADLDIGNQRLTLAGDETWSGSIVKSGGGRVTIARPSGNISVASGAELRIEAGQFVAGGQLDPFTDSTSGAHVGLVNNAAFIISAGQKRIGALGGSGATTVEAGAKLTVDGPQSHLAGATLGVQGETVLNSNAGTAATAKLPAVANLSITVSGEGSKLALNADQVLKSLVIDAAAAGKQSLDLASPAGGFRSVRVYATDRAAAEIALYGAIRHAAANAEDGIYDSGLAGRDGAALGIAQVNDAYSDAAILIRPTVTGDLNLDGTVSIADFLNLAANFGDQTAIWSEGDINYDGAVSIADFLGQSARFGTSFSGSASAGSAAVPEPGILLTVGGLALALAKRGRRPGRVH